MDKYYGMKGWWVTGCGKFVDICNYLSTSDEYKYVGKLKSSYRGEESLHLFNKEGISSNSKYKLKEKIEEEEVIK